MATSRLLAGLMVLGLLFGGCEGVEDSLKAQSECAKACAAEEADCGRLYLGPQDEWCTCGTCGEGERCWVYEGMDDEPAEYGKCYQWEDSCVDRCAPTVFYEDNDFLEECEFADDCLVPCGTFVLPSDGTTVCDCGSCDSLMYTAVCAGGGPSAPGQCCQPSCWNVECGDDGCGGSCGACDDGDPCTKDECLGDYCESSPVVPCPYLACRGGPCERATFAPDGETLLVTDTCVPEDLCHTAVCQPDWSCLREPITCEAPACRSERCVAETGECSYGLLPCEADGDCPEDCAAEPCLQPRCDPESKTCGSGPRDCEDDEICTVDSCDPLKGCVHDDSICIQCLVDEHCDLGSDCVDFSCGGDHRCVWTPVPDQTPRCCLAPADCDDLDPETTDACEGFTCKHAIPTCACLEDSDCPDQANPCVTPTCQECVCLDLPVEGCCLEDEDCDDGEQRTLDTCDTQTHGCEHQSRCLGDRDPCTIDYCVADGVMSAEPKECPVGQACSPVTGQCQ